MRFNKLINNKIYKAAKAMSKPLNANTYIYE